MSPFFGSGQGNNGSVHQVGTPFLQTAGFPLLEVGICPLVRAEHLLDAGLF
jgi:hypothetical protein